MVSLDLPGTGSSSPPAEWTADSMSRSLLDAIDRLGIDRFILVGHSMGGNMSARIALLVPDRVTHLALVAAAVHSDKISTSKQHI